MKERDILKIYNNYCIIGMSPDPKKHSYQLYQCLKNAGKHVYGISPKYDTIDNDKMYTSLIDIEYPVDVVVFVVNKTIGMTYIREMRELGIKYAWLHPGTYDEDLLHAFHDQGIETIENCVLQVMNG